MTKKILIFSTAYFPLVGGAEVAVKEITGRLVSLGDGIGIEFHMITARLDEKSPKEEKMGNINVYRVNGPKFLFPFTAFLKARQLRKRNDYDLIWAIMASYAGFVALFFKMANPKIPYLLTLQEGDSEKHILKRVGVLYPLWKKIFARADYVQVISNYLADFARRHGAKCQVEIVPNGVDVEKFAREFVEGELDEAEKNIGFSPLGLAVGHNLIQKKAREEKPMFFGEKTPSKHRTGEASSFLRAGDKILITTSRLVKKNAVDDVIRSLKYLPQNTKFIVLGSGPDLETLKKLAKDEGAADRVLFLGTVEYKEIPKYLKIADILVRPSLSEGMGNSFIEAMAAGLPVIATQEGGIADFLFDRERNPDKEPTGWAVNPRDPKGIAEAVKKIIDNPEQTAKTVANAKKLAFEKYDWNLIADKMKNIFNKLCVS
ncbi:MAG: glycosyltransferase family 4 protein [bacterium]|nr:glycosyltransferase family 4 protein [bacterium]